MNYLSAVTLSLTLLLVGCDGGKQAVLPSDTVPAVDPSVMPEVKEGGGGINIPAPTAPPHSAR